MNTVIFFRGTRTDQIIADSPVGEGDHIIVVCADGDRLARPGDVPINHFAAWLESAYETDFYKIGEKDSERGWRQEMVTVVCNGGPSVTAFAAVSHLLQSMLVGGNYVDDGNAQRYAVRLIDVQPDGVALLGIWGSLADVQDALREGWADKRVNRWGNPEG